MMEEDFLISGFESEGAATAVDFAAARQLEAGGSTCDVYECMVQRRRVFVKRLKAELRDNPLYRDAFAKEYDLGVSLSHPSLPRYTGFGGDYIVMDFVEGDTLADLIRRGDSRLRDMRFVKRLLLELVDAVEYLHRRNIVHCDIKPDNVIVSPYPDRPATLIDFDKAYSPWLDSTHGDTAKYGCEGCADGVVDFRGIGRIADRLGMKRVGATARRKEVSAEALRKALQRHSALSRWWIWVIAGCIMISGGAALWVANRGPAVSEIPPSAPEAALAQADTVVIAAPVPAERSERPAPAPTATEAPRPEALPTVDEIVRGHYSALMPRHEFLRALVADTASSARKLQLAIASYAADQEKAQAKIIAGIMERYKLTNPLEATSILSTSTEWRRFMREDAEINRLYSREIERREGL